MRLRNVLPQRIKDCRTIRVLEQALEKKRLAHSLLFYGQDLTLLEDVAYALAKILLETSNHPSKHPDCFVLRPGNKMRGIGAEETRQLIRKIQQSSNQGGAKVAIIYEADRMNGTAANIFLKTLEEPPPQTIIVLLSIQPYRLLETIRSRTITFHFPSAQAELEDEDWKSWLNDYGKWLEYISNTVYSPKEYAQSIFMIYGLLSRFQIILEQLGTASWKIEQNKLPVNLSDEQKVALETGFLKGMRRQLFAEIEEYTHSCMRMKIQQKKTRFINVFAQSIACLESVNNLLEVNLNESSALEHLFLVSVGLWKE